MKRKIGTFKPILTRKIATAMGRPDTYLEIVIQEDSKRRGNLVKVYYLSILGKKYKKVRLFCPSWVKIDEVDWEET